MAIFVTSKEEKKILESVQKDAKAEDIYKSIVEKAECCVNHLCGCNCSC